MVVIDASVLILLLHPSAKAPLDRKTKQPVAYPKERIDALVQSLAKDKETLLIPAPALSEVLAGAANAMSAYQEILGKSRYIEVAPFDHRAAVEAAELFGVANRKGLKRGRAKGPWQKIKVDQQIIAIARSNRAGVLYTCDDEMEDQAIDAGLTVVRLEHIQVPNDARQIELELEVSEQAKPKAPALAKPTKEPPKSGG